MSKTTSPKWVDVTEIGAVPLKEGRRVTWRNKQLALFNLGDRFVAIDNQCPHKQGPLADGIVAGNSVFCPLHNLQIDMANGCAMQGGEGRVNTYPVKQEGGRIFIAFE